MESIEAGAPTFRGMYRQYVQSDYTLSKALKELVDNVYTSCDEINIKFKINDSTLYSISVSDNRKEGFKNLDKTGPDNPLNLAHMREGQSRDDETSQFGIGLKAGSMSTANKMTIYTRNDDNYFKVVSDYLEMYEDNTFNSEKYQITREEYFRVHAMEYGSTILLENIRPSICAKKNEKTLKTELINDMSDTYNTVIRDRLIRMSVQGDLIHYKAPVYDAEGCRPFTRESTIYQYGDKYYMIEGDNYIIYNNELGKLLTFQQTKKEVKVIREETSVEIAKARSTFIMWFEYLDANLPFGKIDINRQGRKIGTWFQKARARNGSKNYTQSEITISSKKIAEQMGLTYNKNISEEQQNNLTMALRKFVDHLSSGFNADISTPQYKLLEREAIKRGLVESESESEEPVKKFTTGEPKKLVKQESSESESEEESEICAEVHEPTKKVTSQVAKQLHFEGLTDEEYDRMMNYLVKNKSTFKNDARSKAIYKMIL